MKYQICINCVMDTSDPLISFNEDGVCSHCLNFESNIRPVWHPDETGAQRLMKLASEIKNYGKDKEYDCVLGVSGGVDSSYLLYVAKEIMGLRPLAVHVDAGWNSELAVRNIENLTKGLGVELFTHVIDWEEMKDLHLAYLKSSVANQDVPQDHAFFAQLYRFAVESDIRFVLHGANIASESILPKAWGYNAMDAKQLKAIHRQFGSRPLKTYPISGLFRTYVYYPYIRRMKVVKPLNLMPFNKDEAIEFLGKRFGWVYYGGKHFESRWTRFFQSYYLPIKFGFDKRRAHLSSLVVAKQMTREVAMMTLSAPSFDASTIDDDISYVAKKLEINIDELMRLMALPNKTAEDYPSNRRFEQFLRFGQSIARKIGLLS
jgi:N-acetyl sugar amidotransferase